MDNNKLTMSAPWVLYYKKINALFGVDDEINIEFDEKQPEIKLRVNNPKKADALQKLLPPFVEFGSVKLLVTVIPANALGDSKFELLCAALAENPAVAYVDHIDGSGFTADYVVFEPEVVQYYGDNLSDINGNFSTLYQDIAKDIFGDIGVFFCTADLDE